MPGGTRDYSRRLSVIRIPTNRTNKQKKIDSEVGIITRDDLSQFESYYDIKSVAPLLSRNSGNDVPCNNKYFTQEKIFIPKTKNAADKGLSCNMSKSRKPFKYNISTVTVNEEIANISQCTTDISENENDVMDWNNYHRLNVIYEFMDTLENDYPALCTTGVIGKSLEGRDIKILKISNSNASNASVWIDAGIHAREWIGPAVNTFIANHIARNFDALPVSMRNKDWFFLPVANPDGYEYSHMTNRMWRKNKASINSQVFGVDLNRNFSFGWGGKGSSSEPTHAFYRGPKPFSEPESSAIKNLFTNSGLEFKVYITLHSYGQVIIMPYAYTETLAPDYITLLRGATVMSRAIYNTNGNIYKVGVSKDVMYHASGTSNDWCHGVMGIPFCYLIELRSKQHKFKLPEPEISETGIEILNCLTALMEFVDKFELPQETKSCDVIQGSHSSFDKGKSEAMEGLRHKDNYVDCKGVKFALPIPQTDFDRESGT